MQNNLSDGVILIGVKGIVSILEWRRFLTSFKITHADVIPSRARDLVFVYARDFKARFLTAFGMTENTETSSLKNSILLRRRDLVL